MHVWNIPFRQDSFQEMSVEDGKFPYECLKNIEAIQKQLTTMLKRKVLHRKGMQINHTPKDILCNNDRALAWHVNMYVL